MNRKRWRLIAVLLTVLVFAFSASPVFGEHHPNHGKGKSGSLTGNLTVGVAGIPDDAPHFHVTVTKEDVEPVKGAKVEVTIRQDDPDGSVVAQLQRKTDSEGVAHFGPGGKHPNQPAPGRYVIDAIATKDDARGECNGCLVVLVDDSGNITFITP